MLQMYISNSPKIAVNKRENWSQKMCFNLPTQLVVGLAEHIAEHVKVPQLSKYSINV